MFEDLISRNFDIDYLSHSKAILSSDFPEAVEELEGALSSLKIPVEELVASGGGEAKSTQRLRRGLAEKGWDKSVFEIKKIINGVERESQSHEIDHVRTSRDGSVIALEIEWNNKDPFFDRDLENFKRLHSEGAISVGVVVTRGASLQASIEEMVRIYARKKKISNIENLTETLLRIGGKEPTARQKAIYTQIAETRGVSFAEAWATAFVQDKFATATTHWAKLQDRVSRGVGNPCPLLLIGLPADIVTD